MAHDTNIRDNTETAAALRLFHHKLYQIEALGLDKCRRYVEELDAKYGPVGITALLEAYGASYLAVMGSGKHRPSEKQWKDAKSQLGREPGLQVSIGYIAETMRLLDDVFSYCFEANQQKEQGTQNAREAFETLETRFVKSLPMLHPGLREAEARTVFAEAMRLAQDAIEEVRQPLGIIEEDAVSQRSYWTQKHASEHPGSQQEAMRRYFDRLFDVPRFRRSVEALAMQVKEERGLAVDTRFKEGLKPLVVAAYPYAEAFFYPSHMREEKPLKHRSPIHKATLSKFERALMPVEKAYPGKEWTQNHGMRVPEVDLNPLVGASQKVARMVGIGEAVFNVVAEGRALSQSDHPRLPSPAQRIAADMVSNALASSQDDALAFVKEAALIAREELRHRGRGNVIGRS